MKVRIRSGNADDSTIRLTLEVTTLEQFKDLVASELTAVGEWKHLEIRPGGLTNVWTNEVLDEDVDLVLMPVFTHPSG